jgi:hypothetical protein
MHRRQTATNSFRTRSGFFTMPGAETTLPFNDGSLLAARDAGAISRTAAHLPAHSSIASYVLYKSEVQYRSAQASHPLS